MEDQRTIAHLKRLQRRWLTLTGNRTELDVTAAATTLIITLAPFEYDEAYGVTVTPSWDTTVWVTGKQVDEFTINFGSAAPANATIDLATFREEA